MHPELRLFIENSGFDRPAVERVAEMLPASDAELDECIAEAVRQDDMMAFMLLVVAALSRDRAVQARHLARGARLLPGAEFLCRIVWSVQGDMPEYLLEGMRNTVMHRVCEAAALLATVLWCEERRGGIIPDDVIPRARALARRVGDDSQPLGFLLALALRRNDDALQTLLRRKFPAATDEKWKVVEDESRTLADSVLKLAQTPILDIIPDAFLDPFPIGGPIRRAAPQVGRNEPCPCGSGKKYKQCCYEKDRERLRRSSEVEGLTQDELRRNPEALLTAARLERTGPVEASRLSPARIPRSLLSAYFLRLAAFNLFQRAMEAFEELGYDHDLEEAWGFVMYAAVRAGNKDVAERLMKLRKPHGFTEKDLGLSEKLLLAQDDPARRIHIIEEAAQRALETDDIDELLDIAYAVSFSRSGALGLLLYRGVIPLLTPQQASDAYEQMLVVRDRLSLAPDDPIADVVDTLLAQYPDADNEAETLRETQQNLEAKRREVRALKESLEQFRKEVARRERMSAPQPATAPMAAADEQTLQDLKKKIGRLKAVVAERQDERKALRRELQNAQNDLRELRNNIAPGELAAAEAEARQEEELLLPEEAGIQHPVRLLEFPRNFQERLNESPRHIARTAMSILGALASGSPAAFTGAVRLKACPSVMRQRIADFRLLFRLLPDRIQVVDLIPRRDLDRAIKTLTE